MPKQQKPYVKKNNKSKNRLLWEGRKQFF